MKRTAFARWEDGLKSGRGSLTTESGTIMRTEYSFGVRYRNGLGITPEELLAAAEAACLSMTLVVELDTVGIKPQSIHTTATVRLAQLPTGFEITKMDLAVHARISGADRAAFERAMNSAKQHSPILGLFRDSDAVSMSTVLTAL